MLENLGKIKDEALKIS